MSNPNQDQRQVAMWGLIGLVVSLGCTTGCFCCFWAGLKNKNQSLLRTFAGCMFFSAVLNVVFSVIFGSLNRTKAEEFCKECIEKNSSSCIQANPGGRGPGIPLNTRDCGFYGNRDYGFNIALSVVFFLLQIAAGTLTLKLSEKMNYFVTSKMNQFRAQQGQVQIVGTSGATIVTGQPTIVSSGQPTIVSSGQPTIVSSGQPTIVSSGQPTIVSSGQPTIVSSGQPTIVNSGQ
eukprot:g5119.t1